MRDAAITDVHSVSAVRSAQLTADDDDRVRVYVVRRGLWTVSERPDGGGHTVSAGQFLVRSGRSAPFEAAPHTTVQIIVLPSETLTPLLRNRSLTGPAGSAELRLLAAHAKMVHATIADLGPAGVQAAQGALIELAKGVVMRQFDDVEPRLVPVLAEAARDLVNSRLADPELSPGMLARELSVSVRTLQRAFTAVGEPVTTYIRNRRLEEARLALTMTSGLSVSELAAYWQFTDSSHFIRAFKKRYGQTPVEYAHSVGSAKT
ncbi:helix-turn-helix domain-containing protein [Streptomyces chartreusis]|uniref:helix-turn-helix domain-containing protein n=1 Tax=Streptomyces chartreusis TaxID=1969 RepID=UPI0036B7B431